MVWQSQVHSLTEGCFLSLSKDLGDTLPVMCRPIVVVRPLEHVDCDTNVPSFACVTNDWTKMAHVLFAECEQQHWRHTVIVFGFAGNSQQLSAHLMVIRPTSNPSHGFAVRRIP